MANEFKVKNGLIVSGSADIEEDLRVRGILTVDEFHTSITTSSIIYESGSTSFGNSMDDTHVLTGSVNITGSISLNGQAIGTGKLDETTFNTYTASYKVATTDFNNLTGSYNSFTTSYNTNSGSFNTRVSNLESFSSSLDVTFVNEVEFGTFSSSIKNYTSSLNSYTSSLENRINGIESTTSSLNSFSSSTNTTLNLLQIESGSIRTTFNNYTSSNDSTNTTQNSRLTSIETSTGSLNSFSSSTNSRLSTIETSTGSLNSFSSSTNTRLSSIESSTGSLNSYTSSTNTRLGSIETSTGSLNSFTSSINTTIKNKLNTDGVISGSSQILNGSNIVSSSTQVTQYGFATTGSNIFIGTQTLSGSIIPSVDNTYDLGSATHQWRDVYISSGSLYIDNTKVISSTAQELQITTDNGQSIKILEGTTDSIILQVADGDIELKSSADGDILLDPTNGKIMLKGPVEILNGNKIQSSIGGTPVVFASDIVVSGSIDITGTIEGIDLTSFSSSVNSRIGNLETSTGSLNSFTSSTNGRLSSLETSTSSLNSYTSSANSKFTSIESTTSSLNLYTSSNNTRLGVIESTTSSLNSFTSSTSTRLTNLETSTSSLNSFSSSTNSRLNAIETSTGSLNTFTGSINTTIKNKLNTDGVISGSIQININDTTGYSTFSSSISSSVGAFSSSVATTTNNLSTSVATYNLGQDNRLNSIEGKTGSYATTGSNIFQGNQIITGSLFVSQDLIIAGSSSIQHISSSVVNIADNIITVNAQNPSIRFGGLAVIDSGSSPQVSGSMLFDSTNDQWIFVHQNQSTVTSSVLLMGPQTINNLGNESYPTVNRVLKSLNAEHVGDSNISDNGTIVSINSNTEVTGGLTVTGTVSGTNITTIQSSVNSLNSYTSSNTTNINSIQTSTASLNSYTSSTNTRLGVIETTTGSLNTFTSSATSRLSSLETASGSIRTDFNSYTSSNNTRLNTIETSTGSLNTFTSSINTTIKSKLNSDGVLSGSSQVSFGSISGVPSGLVSGSSQISYTGLSNTPSGIVSGSGQITYSGISGIPSGIVSGSSQITYSGISGIPSGIVSGSVQVDLTSTTNYSSGIKTRLNAEAVLSSSAQVVSALPTGTVSGSSQITFGSISGVPSGLVSGSGQISFGSISGVPSGLVSGSSQITLSSTTGFGTYLDQAVKSGSTVTFAGVTSTAGLTVSGTAYYTFNKPSTASYQTVALFGTTSNGIFITSDSGIISRGAYYNGGWIATDTTGGYLNFNTSTGGMNLHVFSGATVGNSVTTTNIFTVSRSDFSFNSNAILHAGNYTSYAMQGAGYSANQNLNTTSTPTFSSLSLTASDTALTAQDNGTGTAWRGRIITKNSTADVATFIGNYNSKGGIFGHNNALNAWNDVYVNTLGANGEGKVHLSNNTVVHAGSRNTEYAIIHVGNYTSYSPSLTGSGASGTWGISISGNAATVTNGVYTTGDQSISGTKTFAVIKADSGSDYPHSFTNTDAGNTHWTNRGNRLLTSNGTNWAGDGKDPIMAIVGSTSATTRGRMIGLTLHNDDNTDNAFSPMLSFSSKSTSAGYNTVYASISGRKTGYATNIDTNWAKGELHFFAHGDSYINDTPTLRLTNTSATFDTSITTNSSLTVNNGSILYFNGSYSLRLDSSSSSSENDLRFGKGGTEYGAIQTNGSDHGFEFYVNTDGSGSGWERMFYMTRDASENIFARGTVRPGGNGTQDLGTSSYRWSTVYTSDLSLSNGIGDYTIVEGENDLFLYNNKQNKVYKFMLQEVNPKDATPKKS